jgi:hypothetical protein
MGKFTVGDITNIAADGSFELRDSQGNGLEGGKSEYFAIEWLTLGTTDANGIASRQSLPINHSFRMKYAKGTVEVADQHTAVDPLDRYCQ